MFRGDSMVGEYYSTWDQLVTAADLRIHSILENDVASVMEDILRENIQKSIYDTWIPKENRWINNQTYQRR